MLVLRDTVAVGQDLPAALLGQELQALLALYVVDAGDGVHLEDVVDPRDVLVADALDVVAAVAVPVEGRALYGFDADRPGVVELVFDALTRSYRAGRTHRRREARDAAVADALRRQLRRDLDARVARAVVVEAVVPELLELVHDPILRVLPQFVRRVVDLLDVALAPRGLHVARAVSPDLVEPLLAHELGKKYQRVESHPRPDVRPSDAVVTGRGPDERVHAGLDVTFELVLHAYGIRGADLVAPRGEVLAVEDDDVGIDAGQFFRQHNVVDAAVYVPPRDVVEVDWIKLVLFRCAQCALPDLGLDLGRMQHLLERGPEHELFRCHWCFPSHQVLSGARGDPRREFWRGERRAGV